jgi:hypothetical protein
MKRLRVFVELLVAAIKEIFDENAYTRFLARQCRESSAAAYADFVEEKHSGAIRRCC